MSVGNGISNYNVSLHILL